MGMGMGTAAREGGELCCSMPGRWRRDGLGELDMGRGYAALGRVREAPGISEDFLVSLGPWAYLLRYTHGRS